MCFRGHRIREFVIVGTREFKMRAEIYPIAGLPNGRLAIMPRPRAGDWLADEIKSWQQSGMNLIVSLLEDAEISELGLEQEATLSESAGLQFVRFPIPDRGVPRSEVEMVALVGSLTAELRKGCGVAIHCRIGVGRSALVAACVLAGLGSSVETSWASIQQARGLSIPDTTEQRAWVNSFVRRYLTNQSDP